MSEASGGEARRFLGTRPPSLPPILRFCLYAAASLFAAYAACLVILFLTDRPMVLKALRLYGLTLVSGREPALLATLTGANPLPKGWAFLLAPMMDLANFLLILVVVWYLFTALARLPGPDRVLAALEKSALRQRKWIRRWGLFGLAAFYWLPGFGTGSFAICAIAVMARIPLRRLVPVLGASAVAVSLFWVTAVSSIASLIPPEGWWNHIPLAIIILIAVLAIYSAAGHWRQQHVLLLHWPVPDRLWHEGLAKLGMARRGDCLEVDSKVLGAAAGIPWTAARRIRTIAELMLMPGMDLELALRLEERGIRGIEALAQLAPAPLIGAIEDADKGAKYHGPTLVPVWQADAKALEMAAGEAWGGPARKQGTA